MGGPAALRPLLDVGAAAEAIAGGRLDTRLTVGDDPDLDVLAVPFNHMAQALEDRIDRDARFASEVSHELRSPLMTLAASVEVLENSRDEMPERAQTALDLLSADVDRFQQLVEDLLEISRFDAGAIKLHLEEVLVAEMVIQAVSVLGGGGVPGALRRRGQRRSWSGSTSAASPGCWPTCSTTPTSTPAARPA